MCALSVVCPSNVGKVNRAYAVDKERLDDLKERTQVKVLLLAFTTSKKTVILLLSHFCTVVAESYDLVSPKRGCMEILL